MMAKSIWNSVQFKKKKKKWADPGNMIVNKAWSSPSGKKKKVTWTIGLIHLYYIFFFMAEEIEAYQI